MYFSLALNPLKLVRFILNCDRGIPISLSQFHHVHGCWWPGNGRSQGINSNDDIDLFCQEWSVPLTLFQLPKFSWEPQDVVLTIQQFHMDLWQYLMQLWHFSQVAYHHYEVHPKGVTSAGGGEYKGFAYKQLWKTCRKLDQYQTSTKHDNAPTLCKFLGMYMIRMWTLDWMHENAVTEGVLIFSH